jgi:hypothetical protein
MQRRQISQVERKEPPENLWVLLENLNRSSLQPGAPIHDEHQSRHPGWTPH